MKCVLVTAYSLHYNH